MKTLNSKRPILLAVLFILVATMMGCAPGSPSASATPTSIPAPVIPEKPTYTVQRGDVIRTLVFSGRVAPIDRSELFFRTSGRIRHVYAKQGDSVKVGQVLADLEIDELERNLTSAQMELEAAQRKLNFDTQRAQANLDIAQLTLEKMKSRGDNATDLAIQELRVKLAQIDVDELKAGVDPHLTGQVEALKASIAEAQIVSPLAGKVLSLSVTEGYAIDAYKPVVVVADTSQLEVSADLPGSQVQDLTVGMPAVMVLVDNPGEEIEGSIRQIPGSGGISGAPTVDTTTRIRFASPASAEGYALGDLVRVTVVLEKASGVLWLPPQAVRTFQGRRFVVVQENNAQVRLDVKVGVIGEDRVEILEGVKENQVVLAP